MTTVHQSGEIHVQVTFPVTKKGPYEANVPPSTTVGAVLAAAMGHFQVQNDSQFTYVLAYDGTEQGDAVALATIAGDRHELRFTLVKKISQG